MHLHIGMLCQVNYSFDSLNLFKMHQILVKGCYSQNRVWASIGIKHDWLWIRDRTDGGFPDESQVWKDTWCGLGLLSHWCAWRLFQYVCFDLLKKRGLLLRFGWLLLSQGRSEKLLKILNTCCFGWRKDFTVEKRLWCDKNYLFLLLHHRCSLWQVCLRYWNLFKLSFLQWRSFFLRWSWALLNFGNPLEVIIVGDFRSCRKVDVLVKVLHSVFDLISQQFSCLVISFRILVS